MQKNYIFLFLKNNLSKVNLSKIIFIFFFGFISRIIINYLYNINVFIDYLHPFSIAYYFVFASFIVFINELFSTFNLSIFPKLGVCFSNIPKFSTLWSSLTFFNFEYFKLSSIRKFFRELYSTFNYHTFSGSDLSNEAKDALGDSLVLRKNTDSDTNNNASSSGSTRGTVNNNVLLSNQPVDRSLSGEDVNRLSESRRDASRRRRREALERGTGRGRGEITRLRREEKLASDLRWEQERNVYPHMSHRSWILQIDGPRMRANLSRSNNVLPSVSQLPILSSSFNTTTFDHDLNLPPLSNNQAHLNNTNNQSSANNTSNNQGNTKYTNNNYTHNNQDSTNNSSSN